MMKSPAVIYAYENLRGSKKSHETGTTQARRREVANDRSIYQLIFLMGLLLALAGTVFVLTATAAGNTFIVNTTDDAGDDNLGDGLCVTANGECSLRAAIEQLNALGADADPHQIHFDISGAGSHVIAPTEALPRISVPVVIDGSTQPGASCPTAGQPADLRIVLDGSNLAGLSPRGLDLSTAGSGSQGSTIRGLVIGNFISDGITIYSDENQIECNHIGVGADGVSPMGNGYAGINIPFGQDNTVGGTGSDAQRNVIAGNDGYGVHSWLGEGNLITNNYIGTTADGLNPLGNQSGIYLLGGLDNSVGGASSLAGNVISGNERYGVHLLGAENSQVLGNVIGTGRDGLSPVPNGWDGMFIYDNADNNTIGGLAPGEGNLIAYNGDSGILLLEQNEFIRPENNALRGNQIFDNGDLGIDLGYDGVDDNDPLDGDGGPNGRQNYPVLTSAASNGRIVGSLESQPNQSYEIDFYVSESCDESSYGQGEIYLGSASLTTDGGGAAAIDVTLSSVALTPGHSVTATATDPAGNTSEFSACTFVDGVDPNAPLAWITDCLGATPPPPSGGNQFVYLPLVTSGSGPATIQPAVSQVAATVNTLPLVDGGIVTGIDGVSLGAISGTLSNTLNISITHTTAPTQTILGDPQVHGAYYHIAADENVLMCDQEKGFVLGLPVPGGVPTDTLAIATIAPQDSDWIFLTGLYDDASKLMLVPMTWLTKEGNTVVLVESVGFLSQREASGSDQIRTGTATHAGSARVANDGMNFYVVCRDSDGAECFDGREILTDFLEQLYTEFSDLGFDQGPWLRYRVDHIQMEPVVVIWTDKTTYEVLGGSCDQLEAPLGNYEPYSKTAIFCFTPPSPLSDLEKRGIRHNYFSALQFGFDDIVANFIFTSLDTLDNEWILDSTASAAEISTSSRMESSPDFDWRPVDVPLSSSEEKHEFSAQDFWVYTGRSEDSGLALLREALESPNAGTMEGIKNFFGGLDVFQYAYWYWVTNQVMLEDGILLNDDDLGDPCTYQGNVEELYWHQLVSNDHLGLTNAPNTLESLTAHVIELLPAGRRPADIDVRDPKTADPSDNLRYKVYVDGEAGCELVADGDRSFSEPEWDAVVAADARVFIIIANINPDEDQKYEVQVESVSYTP